MDCKCPNCKGEATAKTIGGVEYIECGECGWFIKYDDGTWTACDKPENQVGPHGGPQPSGGAEAVDPAPPENKKAPSAKPDRGGRAEPPRQPATDDEDGIEIEWTDKIDY